jgi:hypothetical protein
MFLEGLITSLPSPQTNPNTCENGYITLENNTETSNITITPTTILTHIDINHYFSDNILYIIAIIQKYNKKHSNTLLSPVKYTINYGNHISNTNIELSSMKYNLYILNKSNASINKKIKKQCLTPLDTLSNKNNSIFLLDNKIFFNIDHNGNILYYPDSIEQYSIYPNNTIYNSNLSNKTLANYFNSNDDENNTSPIKTINDFQTMLDKHNYIQIQSSNISITNSYLLNELPHITCTSNTCNTTINENENKNENTADINNGSKVLFGISSLLNWFNPWSYYSSNTTTTQIKNTETTHTEQDTIQTLGLQPPLEIPVKVAVKPVEIGDKYYICSENMNIIKVISSSNKVKILRPKWLDIPIQIENMRTDELENILIEGKNTEINKNMIIQFNKFMLYQSKKIVS